MRELMRLSLNSGLLSSNDHQSLIARIQTQFSRDTNLIENLKLDLKKQVEDNDDLKECLGHLTTASKRLEVGLFAVFTLSLNYTSFKLHLYLQVNKCLL